MNEIKITVTESRKNWYRCSATVQGKLIERDYYYMPKLTALALFRDFVTGVDQIMSRLAVA